MTVPQAVYTMVVRAHPSAMANEEVIIHFAFSSDLPPSELAPRLAQAIDENVAAPGTASSWWSDVRKGKAGRIGGTF